MSNHYSSSIIEDDLENPLLLPSRQHSDNVIFNVIHDVVLQCLTFFGALLFSLAILLLVMNFMSKHEVLKAPESRVNSVFVSSIDVSNSTKGLNWDFTLSLFYPYYYYNYMGAYVNYTGRAWLYYKSEFAYYGSEFASTTRINIPATIYEGRELLASVNFTTFEENIVEDFARKSDITVDFLVEANFTRKIDDSGLDRRAFLMIDCSELKIEFPLNKSEGRLYGGAKSCKVQLCASRSDALQHGKECK